MESSVALRLGAILALALLLQCLFLSRMPGLNADAAWKARRSYETVYRGQWIYTGVNPTNGVIHEYLFAICYAVMGPTVLAIRLPFVLMNVATIFLVWLFIRRFYGDTAGLVCALVMAVYPWFAIKLRIAWPPSSIPFLTMLVACLLSLNRPAARFLAGAVMGLGCYDYQPFTALPVALAVLYVLYRGRLTAGALDLAMLCAGAAAGYAPRIIIFLAQGIGWTRGPLTPLPALLWKALVCIPYFLRSMDGTIIFLRTTGRISVPVVPLNSIVLLGSLWAVFKDSNPMSRPLAAAPFIFLAIVLIPDTFLSTRYLIFAMTAASLVSGLGLYRLLQARRRWGAGVLRLFVLVNLFYIVVNFFVEHGRTGGSLAVFRSGNFDEVSCGYVRMDVLYDALDKRIPVIVALDPLIERNLKFYDMEKGCFDILGSVRSGDDEFYLIDFAGGARADPSRFRGYEISRERPDLKNFAVYRFRRQGAQSVSRMEGDRT